LLENIVSHNRYIIEEKKCEEGTVNRDGLIERKKERKGGHVQVFEVWYNCKTA